jgi:hypothetical protein
MNNNRRPPQQLNKTETCGTIDLKRRVEMWQHLIRLVLAMLYLLCEMQLGRVPEEVKVGKRDN